MRDRERIVPHERAMREEDEADSGPPHPLPDVSHRVVPRARPLRRVLGEGHSRRLPQERRGRERRRDLRGCEPDAADRERIAGRERRRPHERQDEQDAEELEEKTRTIDAGEGESAVQGERGDVEESRDASELRSAHAKLTPTSLQRIVPSRTRWARGESERTAQAAPVQTAPLR